MKLSKKVLLGTSAVLITPLVLAGCGQTANNHSTKTSTKKTNVSRPVKQVHIQGTKSAPKVSKSAVKHDLNNDTHGAKEQTASSKNDAINKVDNEAVEKSGLPVVNLGHGVKGNIDSGAGQRYVTFQMGNWTVTVHGNAVNENADTAQHEASHLLDFFQSNSLPVPHDHGKIMFNADGSNNSTIAWQNGHKVNKFSGNINKILQEAMATK